MKQDLFYQKNINRYDNMEVDVDEIYEKYPLARIKDLVPDETNSTVGLFNKIYNYRLFPLKYRNYLWYLVRQLNLDIKWFADFSRYWTKVLGGRPLWGVEDFYFLRNIYRIRFQNNIVPDTKSNAIHLAAWQRPQLIYQLFHQVYFESHHNYLDLIKKINKFVPQWSVWLEFGCGTGPISSSYLDFFNLRSDQKIYLADIKTLSFHYAAFKFGENSRVIFKLLTPENNFEPLINEQLDVIFCLQVFEHLPSPLKTIEFFYKKLKKSGILCFDFVKTEGLGLDTTTAKNERKEVLNYCRKNFEVLSGVISEDKNTGITIVRKK